VGGKLDNASQGEESCNAPSPEIIPAASTF
jgi:hypothetical protein